MNTSAEAQIAANMKIARLKRIIARAITANGFHKDQLDLRRLALQADYVAAFAELFFTIFPDLSRANLVGPELSAIPLLTAVQTYGALRGKTFNIVVLRRERLPRGRGDLLEGDFIEAPTLAIDDLVDTGATMERLRLAVAGTGHSVKGIFAAFATQSSSSQRWVSYHGIPIVAASSYNDLPPHLRPPSEINTPHSAPMFGIGVTGQWNPPHPNTVLIGARGEPVLGNGRIFLGTDDGELHAIAADTFTKAWGYKPATPLGHGLWSTPLYDDGRVYFTSDDGSLHCLDAGGTPLWITSLGDAADGPALRDQGVIITTARHQLPQHQGSLCIVDIGSGRLLERIAVIGIIREFIKHPTKPIVALGSRDGEVIAVDIRAAQRLWTTNLAAGLWAAPRFTEDGALLIIADVKGRVTALDPASGGIVAQLPIEHRSVVPPLVIGNTAYIATLAGRLIAVDLTLFAATQTHQTDGSILCAPSFIGGNVWIGTNRGRIEAIDPTHLTLSYTTTVDDRVVGRIVAGPELGSILARTNDGRLLRLDLADPARGATAPVIIRNRSKAANP